MDNLLKGQNEDTGADQKAKVSSQGEVLTKNSSAAAVSGAVGSTSDAAAVTNVAGTISSKLRGVVALLAQAFSVVTFTHSPYNVTSSNSQILAANANRKYLLVVNDSDTVIYIKIGANASLNDGIRLNANGGSYEISSAMGNLATGAINAIHGSTGNKVILITEGV